MVLNGETDANCFRGARIFRDTEFAASELRQATTTKTDSRNAISSSFATERSRRAKVKPGP